MTPPFAAAVSRRISIATLARYSDLVEVNGADLPAPGNWRLVRKRAEAVDPACRDWQAMLPHALIAAVASRRYEYILGRLVAGTLLQTHGHANPWLLSEGGRPVWPSGVVGSISHS